jgi:gluconate 5-dehydrogenase
MPSEGRAPLNVRDLLSLEGKRALVTGGSRGLGLQIAAGYGEMGARVVISARKADELEGACAQLRAAGIDAGWITADAASAADVARLAQEAIARLGHVDILVNNAGATWGAPAEEHPLEAWDKVMNLNIRGVFLLTQAIGRASMIPRRSGRIVNVASIAGLFGNPPEVMSTIAYNTSKGALVNFTRALATEWGKHNITVNAVAPTFIFTPGTEEALSDPAFRADTIERIAALHRIGEPMDVAGAVVFLASPAASLITGHTILIDGGWTAR